MIAGMDVARLNFSHASLNDHLGCINLIRGLNKKYRRHIRILGDLEGHRIRVGAIKGTRELELKKHQILWLTQEDIVGNDEIVSFDYRGPLKDIRKGQHIYIDDGNIALIVEGHERKRLKTKVISAGKLKEHKGVNIPGAKLRFGSLSEKDRKDIRFTIQEKLDYIAQSFVRSAKDIYSVRRLLKDGSHQCKIIAKIESREGIKNIDSIIDASDGIMIARGDMGVAVPVYEIPVIQKIIIKKCNKKRKFVITATQMLESMTDNRIPTRAEVTDVANAIIDGTNYVMLSAESAVGNYPVETVYMMNQIIKFTEKYLKSKGV